MKIFHVLHGFAPELRGGTELTVEALARGMQMLGHELAVVCGSIEPGSSAQVDDFDHDGLRVLRMHRDDLHYESFEKAWSPRLSRRFEELLERERPDVLHVHHWIRLSSDLLRTARRLETPVVACTLHDYWTQCAVPTRRFGDDVARGPAPPPWMGAAEAREALSHHRADLHDELRAAQLRFAPCAAHAIGLEELAGTPLGEILPSPPPLLDPPARRADLDTARGKRLLFWGNIYPEKGLELLFDALSQVEGWELQVLGEAHDPAYRAHIAERAAELPVTLHGDFRREDLVTAPGDYAVLPALSHESYGLVLDEARCLGLPILAADLPAFRERAPAGSALLFEPGSVDSLVALLRDEAGLQALRPSPPPELQDALDSARFLLRRYEETRVGEHAPLRATPAVDERRRAEMLFARAERRFWSALQKQPIVPPPDSFLADQS